MRGPDRTGDSMAVQASFEYEPAMRLALRQAEHVLESSRRRGVTGSDGDIPVGAVILDPHGGLIAVGRNRRGENADPLAHAEVEAMKAASIRLDTWNLEGCTLVVTLEPCPMCAGAAVMAHIRRIVFGAWDDRLGACGSVWDIPRDPHVGANTEIYGGILADEGQTLLKKFFADQRAGRI
jgi:tRNA(adenine34) deaminase